MKRIMIVVIGLCLFSASATYEEAWAEESYGWNFKPAKNNETPTTEEHYLEWLDTYDGYFLGNPKEKELYVTFDSGYENGTMPDLLDTLKEKQVPAAFFVTGHYLESEPELILRMANEGHIVANHSWSHPHFPDLSDESIIEELKKVEDHYFALTGKPMHYVRPPRGTFNERTLEVAREFGYHHIFWSFAYVDWNTDDQKGKAYAYDKIMDRVHPGAILLLHSVSTDNRDALGDVIDQLKAEGYTFKSLDQLTGKHSASPIINGQTSEPQSGLQPFVTWINP
ncbi:polysaccharide deacetylase [Bacillaceae bacterium JMAK1]|nr:polysaccharide deacetylase [Bacillaceae bacterium JMAK1]